jgi:hydrogenase maturation protease
MSPLDIVVAGLGSTYRGDDAVGPMVAALFAGVHDDVRDVGPLAEPLDLLGRFDGADLAVVIDAVRSGAPIGTVQVMDIDVAHVNDDGTVEPAVTSTHGIGLVGVLRVARAIDRAPRRLVVVAVEGEAFELGSSMSAAVQAAVPEAFLAVARLIESEQLCA